MMVEKDAFYVQDAYTVPSAGTHTFTLQLFGPDSSKSLCATLHVGQNKLPEPVTSVVFSSTGSSFLRLWQGTLQKQLAIKGVLQGHPERTCAPLKAVGPVRITGQ
jgi:hypothetical protein